MKKSEAFFSLILIPIDAFLILASFILAYYWRKNQGEVIYIWEFSEYIRFIVYLLPAWILIFALEGLYNIKQSRKGLNEFFGIIIAVSSGIMLVVAWIFLSRTFFFSRLVIIYAWIIAIVFITLGRNLIRFMQTYLYNYNIGVHRLILIGNNDVSYTIAKFIKDQKNLGYKLIGIIGEKKDQHDGNPLKYLGNITDLVKIVDKNYPVDEIIVTDRKMMGSLALGIMQFCQERKIAFLETPNFLEFQGKNIDVSTIAGIPIVEFKRTRLDGWWRIIKRLLDILGGLIGMIIFSPLMLILAILIKLDSSGPVIYKNERVSDKNKTFNVYKFRTMKIEYCTGIGYGGKKADSVEKELIKKKNERNGPVYKVLNDPRRTRMGRFLEKLSLDELPQFFNVFTGNMSLVGPRPHQPKEVAKYQSWHKKVLRIKPGLTGMAQISGRSDLDFNEEARLDIYYIENWTFWLDLQIIFKTPLAVIKPRKTA